MKWTPDFDIARAQPYIDNKGEVWYFHNIWCFDDGGYSSGIQVAWVPRGLLEVMANDSYMSAASIDGRRRVYRNEESEQLSIDYHTREIAIKALYEAYPEWLRLAEVPL